MKKFHILNLGEKLYSSRLFIIQNNFSGKHQNNNSLTSLTRQFIINVRLCVFDGIVLQWGQSTHTAPPGSVPAGVCARVCVCAHQTLTPVCEGHSEVQRRLVEGPEWGVSPFSQGFTGTAGVSSVVCWSRFEVLWRSTKPGPSAPLVSPPSSLKGWIKTHNERKRWVKMTRKKSEKNVNMQKLTRTKVGQMQQIDNSS